MLHSSCSLLIGIVDSSTAHILRLNSIVKLSDFRCSEKDDFD